MSHGGLRHILCSLGEVYDAIAVEVSQTSKYMHISPCSPCSHCSPISSSILSSHISQHTTTGFGDGRCARSQRADSPSCGRCFLPSSVTYPNPDEIRQPLQSNSIVDIPYTRQLSRALLTVNRDPNYWISNLPPDATANIWSFIDNPYTKTRYVFSSRSTLQGSWKTVWESLQWHRRWCELDALEQERQLLQETRARDDELAEAMSHGGRTTLRSTSARSSVTSFWPHGLGMADTWTPSPHSPSYQSYQSS